MTFTPQAAGHMVRAACQDYLSTLRRLVERGPRTQGESDVAFHLARVSELYAIETWLDEHTPVTPR